MSLIKLCWLGLALMLGFVHNGFSTAPILPDPFPYLDFPEGVTIAYQTYAHMICDFLVMVIITGVLASTSKEFKVYLWIFCGMVVADLIDYLLCYNAIWFYLGDIPISMNTTKVFIFGLTIFYEWLTSIGHRYFG
jgi:hypothetical protein